LVPRLAEGCGPSHYPRTHSREQVANIATSIREFGWTNPILVGAENDLLASHARMRPRVPVPDRGRKKFDKGLAAIELQEPNELQTAERLLCRLVDS